MKINNKFLSINFYVRNDDYHINFINRFEYCLNYALYNLDNIKKLNDVEFNIIDWGSNIPISNNLRMYEKKFSEKVNFYYVKRSIANKLSAGTPAKFNTEKAINLGIFKSKGEFILFMHHDIIFSVNSWKNIFNTSINNNKFFWIPRKYINPEFEKKNPNFMQMDAYLEKSFSTLDKFENIQMQHGGGAVGFLFKRKNWIATKGVYENLKIKGQFSGSDADIIQKVNQRFDHVDSSSVGFWGYKILPSGVGIKYNNIKKFEYTKNLFYYAYISKKNFINRCKLIKVQISKAKLIDKNILLHPTKNNFDIKLSKKNSYLSFILNLKLYFYIIFETISISEIVLNYFILSYIKFSRIFNYVTFSKKKNTRISLISRLNSFLEIYAIDFYSKNNKINISENYIKINRFLNRNHTGYYRFILSKDFNLISNFLSNISFQSQSTILEILNDQLTKKQILAILKIISDHQSQFSLLVLGKNFVDVKQSLKSNFIEILSNNDYNVFISKNLQEENGAVDSIKKLHSIKNVNIIKIVFAIFLARLLWKLNVLYRNAKKKIYNLFF